MRQEIAEDPFDFEDWAVDVTSRCFVHLVNAGNWAAIADELPPTKPPTPRQYRKAGIPWFEYYDELITPVGGSSILRRLKSVSKVRETRGDPVLLQNYAEVPAPVVQLRRGLSAHQVREARF